MRRVARTGGETILRDRREVGACDSMALRADLSLRFPAEEGLVPGASPARGRARPRRPGRAVHRGVQAPHGRRCRTAPRSRRAGCGRRQIG